MMESFDQICDRLRSNAADLTILNLNYQGIGNRGAVLLADALRSNRTLVVLFLECNSISDLGARRLAESAAQHPRLQHLFLSHNTIGNDGARSWAEALRGQCERQGLQVLKLAHNRIGAEGAVALGEALRWNRRLRMLVLDSNPAIGPEGVLGLAEGLKVNDSLMTLDVSYCYDASVAEQGWGRKEHVVLQALLSALETNRALKELVLAVRPLRSGPAATKREEELLSHLVRLNRLGRRHMGASSIPRAAWPRLLAAATLLDSVPVVPSSQPQPSLLYAVLRARPDLLLEDRSLAT